MKTLALGLLAVVSLARADRLDTGIGLLSDKVVRGLSQSRGEPVAVADGVWRGDTGWALSAGLATLGRHNPGGDAELTLGAGVGGSWSDDWDWQASAVRYVMLGRAGRRPGYAELSGTASWAGRLQMTLTAAPDYPGIGQRHGRALVAEMGWHQPIGFPSSGLALDAGVGQIDYRRTGFAGYRYGSLGLSWSRGPWQLVAMRVFSDSHAPSTAGPRLVLSVLRTGSL